MSATSASQRSGGSMRRAMIIGPNLVAENSTSSSTVSKRGNWTVSRVNSSSRPVSANRSRTWSSEPHSTGGSAIGGGAGM